MTKRKRNKPKGANQKGAGGTNSAPTISRRGLHPCECEHFLGSIKENFQHQYGKHQPIELSSSDIFLSLAIPHLATLVADNNLALTSNRADIWVNYNKERINALELSEKAAAIAKEQEKLNIQTRKEERRCQTEAQRFAKQAAENAISFLSFKYGGSVEQRRDKFGSQVFHRFNYPISVLPFSLHDDSRQPILVLSTSTTAISTNETITKQHALTANQDNIPSNLQKFAGIAAQSSPSDSELTPVTPQSTLPYWDQAFPPQKYSLGSLDCQKHSLPNLLASETIKVLSENYNMSTSHIPDTTGGVDNSIKDVIQNLFVLQQHVSAFRSENQERLNLQVEEVAKSLTDLERVVSKPNNPLHSIRVAPDIIDYVDDGRNPDIYTRDFVELVQRGNSVMNGKQKAFKDFSKVFAKALKENFDGLDDEVDMIMADAGMEEKDGKFIEKESQDRNGA